MVALINSCLEGGDDNLEEHRFDINNMNRSMLNSTLQTNDDGDSSTADHQRNSQDYLDNEVDLNNNEMMMGK